MSAAQNALRHLMLGTKIARLQYQQQADMKRLYLPFEDDEVNQEGKESDGEEGEEEHRFRRNGPIWSQDASRSPASAKANRTKGKEPKESVRIVSKSIQPHSHILAIPMTREQWTQVENGAFRERAVRNRHHSARSGGNGNAERASILSSSTKPAGAQKRKKKVTFAREIEYEEAPIGRRPEGMPLREWKLRWVRERAVH